MTTRHRRAVRPPARLGQGGRPRPGTAARRARPAPWCGRARRSAGTVGGSAASEGLGRERPVQADRDQRRPARPRAAQRLDRLLGRPGARPHQHDHPLGVGGADVVEQVVLAAGAAGELVHRRLHDPGHGVVERVARLAGLEEDVRVLGRAAQHRAVRATARGRGGPRPASSSIIARRSSSSSSLDLGDLVRGAEAVEEVQERHPRCRAWPRGRRARSRAPPGPSSAASIAQPVVRAAITSLWSPKIDSAWVAMVRAATWMTVGVSSPAILNMLGIISSRPCEAVNVVASAPA